MKIIQCYPADESASLKPTGNIRLACSGRSHRYGACDIAFHPREDFLAVAGKDNRLRIYNLVNCPAGKDIKAIKFDKPVVSCDWSKDGLMVVGSSLDGTAAVLHVDYGYEIMNIVFLESPICCAKFIDCPPASGGSVFFTASWNEIKYWDTRCIGRHIGCLECNAPIQTVDVDERMMVIGTKDRDIHVVDLLYSSKFLGTGKSPLANQTTLVKCLPGTYGIAMGSVGGECAIRHLDGDAWKSDFDSATCRQDEVATPLGDNRNCDWKCYDEELWDTTPSTPSWDILMGKRAVNAISFHRQHANLLSTATSDGTLKIWDSQSQKLVSTFVPTGGAIRATSFNKDSSILAYAFTTEYVNPCNPNEEQDHIVLHKMKDGEIGRVSPEL